jgi:transposase
MADKEWDLTAPLIPPAKRGGRGWTTDMREAINAILYIAVSRYARQMLPKSFPPASTVPRYFCAWRDAGLFNAINTVLVMNLREIEGREASPSAGVIDSQSASRALGGAARSGLVRWPKAAVEPERTLTGLPFDGMLRCGKILFLKQYCLTFALGLSFRLGAL